MEKCLDDFHIREGSQLTSMEHSFVWLDPPKPTSLPDPEAAASKARGATEGNRQGTVRTVEKAEATLRPTEKPTGPCRNVGPV